MKEREKQFQSFVSLLAFILPILQLFLNYLPDKSKNIFLIKEHLLFVSIIAAVFSYVVILIFKNMQYFSVTLPLWHREYLDYLSKQDAKVYSPEEIKNFLRENKIVHKPFYLTFDNVTYVVLFPLMLLSWSFFFFIGLSSKPEQASSSLVFWQSFFYIILVATTALSLAIFYIRDASRKQWREKQELLFSNVLSLLHKNMALKEYPQILFVTQFPIEFNNLLTVIKINSSYYKIITDIEAQKLQAVEEYQTQEALKNSIGGSDAN